MESLVTLLVPLIAALTTLIALVITFKALAAARAAGDAAAAARSAAEELARLRGEENRQVTLQRELVAQLRQELNRLPELIAAGIPAPVRVTAPAAPPATGAAVRPAPAPARTPAPVPVPVPRTPPAPAADDDATVNFDSSPQDDATERPETPPAPPAPLAQAAGSRGDEEETQMFTRPLTRAGDDFHGMPILRVIAGSEAGREYKLPFEPFTIGRSPNNRVMINEEMASRVHAELRLERNRFLVKDAGSTNGTSHNGKPATGQALEFGDVITIGKTELLFTAEGHDLQQDSPERAISAFERLLQRQPEFVPALQTLAFLLERDVARRREAAAVWERLKKADR